MTICIIFVCLLTNDICGDSDAKAVVRINNNPPLTQELAARINSDPTMEVLRIECRQLQEGQPT